MTEFDHDKEFRAACEKIEAQFGTAIERLVVKQFVAHLIKHRGEAWKDSLNDVLGDIQGLNEEEEARGQE